MLEVVAVAVVDIVAVGCVGFVVSVVVALDYFAAAVSVVC